MPQTIELSIESLAQGGSGVAHSPEGKAYFVPHTAPGDLVRAEVVQDKGRFAHAQMAELLEPGHARVQEPCPLAGQCGGCHWQQVAYDAQLAAKRDQVVAALSRIARFDGETAEELVEPCRPSSEQMAYRNKLELASSHDSSGRLVLGFFHKDTHNMLAVGQCPLAHKPMQKAPGALQGALRYLEGSRRGQGDLGLGVFRVGVRHSKRTGACEVALWTAPGPFPRAAAAKTIASCLKTSSIVRVIAEQGAARKVKNVEVLSENGFWEEELGGYAYRVSAPSFFQVNTPQAEVLQHLVLEGLTLDAGARVADLYAGVGTFTLPLAEVACDLVAVESSGAAVRDLRRNAETEGLDIEVVGGDSARELPDLGTLDALVVDPPRAGLAEGVAQSIAGAQPARVAYASCDPATWARDVFRLEECGYRLAKAQPVDLFPQTYHVEVVSIFERL